ncbi:MAG: hypothetical protein PCFJNLEI_03691 [Verrucomicrobiae bacterium]|nr:hypothetical protein [Verrucomicrobiae bacterium]
MSEWGTVALGLSPEKWKHAETEHFIVHFVRNGEKVGRFAEEQYREVREFLGDRPDLLKGRKSQVFAFFEPEDWRKFAARVQVPWAAGITRGDEFFYLAVTETKRSEAKDRTLAHEMTHLVFNRFYRGRLPLWLNEGIAEYFGQRKTSTISQFRQRMGQTEPYHLGKLLAAEKYPERPEEIQAFYAEAAIIVDFLTRTSERRQLLPKFVERVMDGRDVVEGMRLYGYQDWADFEKDYRKYRRHF